MDKWEYFVLELGYPENQAMELNEMGRDGWELFTIFHRPGNWSLAYFKRRAALATDKEESR